LFVGEIAPCELVAQYPLHRFRLIVEFHLHDVEAQSVFLCKFVPVVSVQQHIFAVAVPDNKRVADTFSEYGLFQQLSFVIA
jgi:hypothetical protein